MRQKAIAIIGLLLLGTVSAVAQSRSRSFHLEYKATVNSIPSKSHRIELWIPVPHDDPYQHVWNLRIDSPYPYEITSAADGNTMLHLCTDQTAKRTFAITMTLDAVRIEHVQPLTFGWSQAPSHAIPQQLVRYLKGDRLAPVDDQIRAWARAVVLQANAKTDLERANAIYHHVISTVKYDKSGKGWGRGDIYYVCQQRRGNCTDFHSIFIGYTRALGIPARFAIGFPLPALRGQSSIAGYHCWAEFYAKGIGWVPVDASEAAKDPSKRDYFFGAIDENRIQLSGGRDVILAPKQNGEPLNYFVYPYAEIDGKAFTGTSYNVRCRDIEGPTEAARR